MRSVRFSQDVEPSFHWQHTCQPMVLHFMYVRPSGRTTFWSEGLIAVSSCLWSMMKSRRTYWFLSGSHCAYIASAIKFALSMVSSPSSNVCVNSATNVLGLSHDGLSRHRAGLPAHLGAAVNKVKELPYNSPPKQITSPAKDCLRLHPLSPPGVRAPRHQVTKVAPTKTCNA